MTRRAAKAVGILGAGRAGSALAAGLARAGQGPVVIWDRRAGRARSAARGRRIAVAADPAGLLERVTTLLIAVDDAAVARLAERLARAWPAEGGPSCALHSAGAHPASLLEPLADRGASTGVFHPAVALTGARSWSRLSGAVVTISGERRALREARRLARGLEMHAVEVRDEARPLVHLAAVMAAGDATALLGLSARLLESAGVRPAAARTLLASLSAGAVEEFHRVGAEKSMTGPVVRGDVETLAAHARALEQARLDPRVRASAARAHRALVEAAVGILRREGRLSEALGRRMVRASGPSRR